MSKTFSPAAHRKATAVLRSTSIFLSLALAALVAHAQSQFLTGPAEVRKLADGVMGSVGAQNYDGAWAQMKPYAVVPPAEFDAFSAQFTSQIPNILQRYGSAAGSEFVREEKAGDSLLRLVYLARHQKSAMRWYFIFYRGEKGWILSDFKFDGNLIALFPGQG